MHFLSTGWIFSNTVSVKHPIPTNTTANMHRSPLACSGAHASDTPTLLCTVAASAARRRPTMGGQCAVWETVRWALPKNSADGPSESAECRYGWPSAWQRSDRSRRISLSSGIGVGLGTATTVCFPMGMLSLIPMKESTANRGLLNSIQQMFCISSLIRNRVGYQ